MGVKTGVSQIVIKIEDIYNLESYYSFVQERQMDLISQQLSETLACFGVNSHKVRSNTLLVNVIKIGAHFTENLEEIKDDDLSSKVDDT